jgi:hypothetical protein
MIEVQSKALINEENTSSIKTLFTELCRPKTKKNYYLLQKNCSQLNYNHDKMQNRKSS